jgi:hypothetical protein
MHSESKPGRIVLEGALALHGGELLLDSLYLAEEVGDALSLDGVPDHWVGNVRVTIERTDLPDFG